MQGQVHTDRLFEDSIKFVNFEFKMSGIVFAGRELKYVTTICIYELFPNNIFLSLLTIPIFFLSVLLLILVMSYRCVL